MYQKQLARFLEIQNALVENVSTCTAMSPDAALPGAFCITAKDGVFYRARIDYVSNRSDVLVSFSSQYVA